MTVKHSSVPWHTSMIKRRVDNGNFFGSGGHLEAIISRDEKSNFVAQICQVGDKPMEQAQADLDVMVAGPELLEALKELLDLAIIPHEGPAFDKARDAIARAEGGQPYQWSKE